MSPSLAPPVAPPPEPLPRNVKVLGLASLLNDTASEMIYPLLPHFLLTVLLGNRFHLGVIEGVADAVASFVKLWSGGRSGQAGRGKGVIVFGYCVPALARPLVSVIVAPWQLFAIRVVDRVGKDLRTSPRDALIADSTAPSIQGRALFLVALLPGLLVVVLLVFGLRETPATEPPQERLRLTLQPFDRNFRLYL